MRHQLQSGYTVLLDGEKICFWNTVGLYKFSSVGLQAILLKT